MTSPRERSGAPVETPSEQQLAACLRRLLNTTELNMDDMEEDTREAIREALLLLPAAPADGS